MTHPVSSLRNPSCASTTLRKSLFSASAYMGNLGCPVACVMSWSFSTVMPMTNPGASSVIAHVFFQDGRRDAPLAYFYSALTTGILAAENHKLSLVLSRGAPVVTRYARTR